MNIGMRDLGMTLAMVSMLVGCQQGGADAVKPNSAPQFAGIYKCLPSDGAGASKVGSAADKSKTARQLSVSYDLAAQQVRVSIDGGSVHYLGPIADAKGAFYANTNYAWRVAGSRGLLTDIAEVRVYECTPATVSETASISAPVRR